MSKLLNRYREFILYIIFGGLTTVVSLITFHLFVNIWGMNDLIGNIFSWILTVLFAYVTNKLFVFRSKADGIKGLYKEIISFFSARLLTLGIEEVLLFVGINLLHLNNMIVKLAAQVIVILLNYVLSKLFIFKGKKK